MWASGLHARCRRSATCVRHEVRRHRGRRLRQDLRASSCAARRVRTRLTVHRRRCLRAGTELHSRLLVPRRDKHYCFNLGATLGTHCDPKNDLCAQGLFCMHGTLCGFPAAGSICADPVDEGNVCDSDFKAGGCAECGPGLTCVGASSTVVAGVHIDRLGHCRAPCVTADDCPCGEGLNCSHAYSVAGTCCLNAGRACSRSNDCCGGDSARCLYNGGINPNGGSGICGQCVRDLQGGCTADADCCNARHCVNGGCACLDSGKECERDQQCCFGEWCAQDIDGKHRCRGNPLVSSPTGGANGKPGSGPPAPGGCEEGKPCLSTGSCCVGRNEFCDPRSNTCQCLAIGADCDPTGDPYRSQCCLGAPGTASIGCGFIAGQGAKCTTCAGINQPCVFGGPGFKGCCGTLECGRASDGVRRCLDSTAPSCVITGDFCRIKTPWLSSAGAIVGPCCNDDPTCEGGVPTTPCPISSTGNENVACDGSCPIH